MYKALSAAPVLALPPPGRGLNATSVLIANLHRLVVPKGDVAGGREIARMGPLASALSMEHDLLISTMPVSTESFESRRTPFLDNAREDAVPL